jgi:hypothetical protein
MNQQPKAWPIGIRFGDAVLVTLVLFGVCTAHADAVTDWNAIMEATVLEATPDPFLQVRSATITQRAVFEAVNTIVGDYESYFGGITAPQGASPEAAAIAAAIVHWSRCILPGPWLSTRCGPLHSRRFRTARQKTTASGSERQLLRRSSRCGQRTAQARSCLICRGLG